MFNLSRKLKTKTKPMSKRKTVQPGVREIGPTVTQNSSFLPCVGQKTIASTHSAYHGGMASLS